MKNFIIALSCLFAGISFGQEEFVAKDAIAIIDVFFDGFHKGDTILMRSVLMKDVALQTAFTDKEGNHKVSTSNINSLLTAIADRPEDQHWDERLLDYQVKIDGNLAHVWTPYEFWFNDNFSHCGANAFTLSKTNEGWKIVHLIDSRRKSTCAQK